MIQDSIRINFDRRESSEAFFRERSRIDRLNKRLRGSVGSSNCADVDIVDRTLSFVYGHIGYQCRNAVGHPKIALTLRIGTLGLSGNTLPCALVSVSGSKPPVAENFFVSLSFNIEHDHGGEQLRQIAYIAPEHLCVFLRIPTFRRAAELHPSGPQELTVNDVAILDHADRFRRIPTDAEPHGTAHGLIASGLMVPTASGAPDVTLTCKGNEWMRAAKKRLCIGSQHLPVVETGKRV